MIKLNKTLLLYFAFILILMQPVGVLSQTYFPVNDWRTSTPADQGVDERKMQLGINNSGTEPIDSFHVIRNGHLIYDYIGDYYDSNQLHVMNSVTKTITGLLVGIAIGNGDISTLDEKILDILDVTVTENVDTRKNDITIEDVLQMRSGFEWNEDSVSYQSSVPASYDNYEFYGNHSIENNEFWEWNEDNDFVQGLLNETDWATYLFNKPMEADPGTLMKYNTISSSLLSLIIEEKTDMTLEAYAQANLFSPLGIDNYVWWKDPLNHTMGGIGLWLTPFDMSKLGYMLLNGGVWDGTNVVPSEWINDMTTAHPDGDYGYHISITNDRTVFVAGGYGGQIIHVDVPNNMVIVSTCSAFTIPEDRSNYGCQYLIWKSISQNSFLESETSETSTDATSTEDDSVINFSFVFSFTLIFTIVRLRKSRR